MIKKIAFIVLIYIYVYNISASIIYNCYNCHSSYDKSDSCVQEVKYTKIELIERLLKEEMNAENVYFNIEQIKDTFHIMWSDPGWVDGPDIEVNDVFYVLKYNTTTYYNAQVVQYIDDYTYYIPLSNSELFLFVIGIMVKVIMEVVFLYIKILDQLNLVN